MLAEGDKAAWRESAAGGVSQRCCSTSSTFTLVHSTFAANSALLDMILLLRSYRSYVQSAAAGLAAALRSAQTSPADVLLLNLGPPWPEGGPGLAFSELGEPLVQHLPACWQGAFGRLYHVRDNRESTVLVTTKSCIIVRRSFVRSSTAFAYKGKPALPDILSSLWGAGAQAAVWRRQRARAGRRRRARACARWTRCLARPTRRPTGWRSAARALWCAARLGVSSSSNCSVRYLHVGRCYSTLCQQCTL